MSKNWLCLIAILSIVSLFIMVPAYAEVTSFQTSSSFYKGGSVIQFSGTILSTDSSGVTIVIFDPNGKFLSLVSGIADNNHAFQVNVNTGTTSNQPLFSVKGVYNATAFVTNQAAGKTVNFVFSPDGSPALPSSPTNLVATPISASEVDLSWTAPQNNGGLSITGYKIERNDGNGFNVIANSPTTTTYKDTNLIPIPEHSYRVSAINSAGSSLPSNISPVIMPSSTTPSTQTTPPSTSTSSDQNSGQSLDEILQQRYATAKKLQDMLNGKTSTPSSTSTGSSSVPSESSQQTVQLAENITVSDKAASLEPEISSGVLDSNLNSFANFDIKTVLYPVISLVGVGIVVVILYSRKKRKIRTIVTEPKQAHLPVEQTFEKQGDDYAISILKNRLAKGEITIDEFKTLKDELSEP